MKWKVRLAWFVFGIMLGLVGIIPVRIAIAFHQVPVPQAILVLGGNGSRMEFAAQFWQSHRNLDIWISDFDSELNYNRPIFQKAGVPNSQLRFDGRATDTVTNFTTLVDKFAESKLQHLYLITSDYHMRRSRAIASIVLGSRGIVVTPVAVYSGAYQSESLKRALRDCGRSLLWLVTNRTGASLNPRIRATASIHNLIIQVVDVR